MSDVTNAGESSTIAAAVEQALEQERAQSARSDADKIALATQIYTSWRNRNLGSLTPSAFAQIEASSAELINSIAAQL